MAKHQARVTADRITGNSDAALWDRADGAGAPRVTFTEPQVAAVGLTEQTAHDRGIDVQIVSVGTSANAGGSFWGAGSEGTSQLVIDKQRRVVVGTTFTGSEVQDMLQAATFAVVGELTLEQLRHGIAPFPTRSRNLAEPTWRQPAYSASGCATHHPPNAVAAGHANPDDAAGSRSTRRLLAAASGVRTQVSRRRRGCHAGAHRAPSAFSLD